ncbi:MAG: mannonate dehydratase [Planctomycetes bacterium]|nr:mannonate dehydratase [Planctomycetota bacterium]
MRIMDQLAWNDVTDENLNFFKAIGVDDVIVFLPAEMADGRDHTEEFKRLKKFIEAHGLELHVLHCGGLPREKICYGWPGRDAQIENWCRVVRAIGAAGVHKTATTFFAISHFRTPSTVGRGGAAYSTFDYEEFQKKPVHHPGKEISEQRLWENLEYFYRRVMPVAEEAGVRIALHPDDPPVSEPLGDAARIVVSIENYLRIFDLVPSESNGMLFCQGCVAEMGVNVFEAIRTIGSRNKIFFVHFRNIRGGRYKFQEVFIDEGDVRMLEAMKAYRDVGFKGPFMMDHTPGIPHPSGHWAGRAYANGYIRALIQAVYI